MSENAEGLQLEQTLTQPTTEPREQIPIGTARWLGGLFEAGGSIYFVVENKKGRARPYVYPGTAYGDTDENKIDRMIKMFGGYKQIRGRSYNWETKTNRAVPLITAIGPFAPSKRHIIEAAQRWSEASGTERVALADQLKSAREDNITADDYRDLVELPEFVAGVLDSRAAYYSDRNRPGHPSQLRVSTRNRALLEALKTKYGGNIITVVPAGSSISMPGGKTSVIQKDVIYWYMGTEAAQELLKKMSPFLILGQVRSSQSE